MHAIYSFDFLNTVSEQLSKELESLSVSRLEYSSIAQLECFQTENRSKQGVYLLHLCGDPVYLGKAVNIKERLLQHLIKLSGRRNINLLDVGYKALLLDKSMSTAANETVLLGFFQQKYPEMWNNKGFGPKDPGRQRDNTNPGFFDVHYPIEENYVISVAVSKMSISDLFRTMKASLPYVFRYNLEDKGGAEVDVSSVRPVARELLQLAIDALGPGWKGVVLAYGMIAYRTNQEYEFGEELLPRIK
ncbi:hypothetical protein G7069_07820 [Lysobacter sp. HDW10]|uniref:hypothetical protein n=1 Tax=Lysobacter sp. HDW10 TaxID=2714936 RepID=UPI00140BE50D|nr:hypothetical protein [Lysobacter sp. HDW10]QIK81508.1 hypothetical protein G7069_07820 [Lysobacter sp. HDW10]